MCGKKKSETFDYIFKIETMEELFRKHQYPDSESIELLAEKVGVSTGRVTVSLNLETDKGCCKINFI